MPAKKRVSETATGVLLPEGLGVDDPAPAVAATAVTPPSSEGTVH